MMATLTGSRIRIERRLPDVPCYIDADPSQFDATLINLAVNARDAMDGQGQLAIVVESVEGVPALRSHPAVVGAFVAVSLADTGTGIEDASLDKIFEPFFTTKPVGHGTGLGRSQVFGFVKQSGGAVGVDSEVGRGTTFRLYFPRVAEPGEAPRIAAPHEAIVAGQGTRVLLVEDNPDVGSFSARTLQELGFETTLAGDAEQALSVLAASGAAFDVVFSDVMMPGMNGIELARTLGRLHPELPVVLTSGYSEVLARDGDHGYELLQKPYSIEDLTRVLRRATQTRRSQ